MAFSRSATLAGHRGLGESVWLLLCSSTLRGIHWSARALASDDDDDEWLERAELLAKLGAGRDAPAHPEAAIDWAKLDEVERARVERELGVGWGV